MKSLLKKVLFGRQPKTFHISLFNESEGSHVLRNIPAADVERIVHEHRLDEPVIHKGGMPNKRKEVPLFDL